MSVRTNHHRHQDGEHFASVTGELSSNLPTGPNRLDMVIFEQCLSRLLEVLGHARAPERFESFAGIERLQQFWPQRESAMTLIVCLSIRST